MQKLLIVIFAVIIHTLALSQTNFGIKGGLVSANQDWSLYDVTIGSNPRQGALFGAFAKMMLSQKFGLQPELLYTMKGSKVLGNAFESPYDLILDTRYLSLPLVAKYYEGGLNVQCGLSLDYLLSAEFEVEGVKLDFKDGLSKTDFGLVFGAGYDFNFGLILEVRYVLGLTDVSKFEKSELFEDIEDIGDLKIKNRCLMFNVGYMFK